MKIYALIPIIIALAGCSAAKLDTGMGSYLTIDRYGVHGATVRYANPYNPGGYTYQLHTWEELKQQYPMLTKELDELQQRAVKEKR